MCIVVVIYRVGIWNRYERFKNRLIVEWIRIGVSIGDRYKIV